MIPNVRRPSFFLSFKRKKVIEIVLLSGFLLFIALIGNLLSQDNISTRLEDRNSLPSFQHLFGTDWLGRDMFARTLMGLSLSIKVGFVGAICSTLIAVTLGVMAATMGKWVDSIVSWLIDLFLSVPHLVTLILISFALGGGFKGIVVGIALTHWPSLARLIRAEVMQIRSATYIQISQLMGKSRWWILRHHFLPHLLPQMIVGFLLLFPHTILHEASVTFLGMGLSPHEPAIGIILSESMNYLSSGMWWLAVFPGICLLVVVRLFDYLGMKLQDIVDQRSTNSSS